MAQSTDNYEPEEDTYEGRLTAMHCQDIYLFASRILANPKAYSQYRDEYLPAAMALTQAIMRTKDSN